MDYEGLEVRPGGLLIDTYWDSDAKSYKERDVTDDCLAHLFDNCELHPDVTLQDIFLLINSQIEMFALVLGVWIEELTQEALNPTNHIETEINYLELYWKFSYEEDPFTKKTVLTGTRFPSFHGVGNGIARLCVEQDSDPTELEVDAMTGDIFYGVSLSKVNELAPLKLKLRDEIIIHDFREQKSSEIAKFKSIEYTFGQIIYGIFWELTFYGSPKMRDEMNNTLQARIDAIKDGKVKLIPWDEVEKSLRKNLE